MKKIKNFFRNQFNKFVCFILEKLMNYVMKKQFGDMNLFNNMEDEEDNETVDNV